MRRKPVAVGLVLLVMWFGCWAATVVPGTSAVAVQWAVGNALALAAGVAFGVAGRRG
ncbi:hypothetical protein [Limnoglobus roseus]|uniref:hypothetical protein n=1 Tax=Limnoglobus roseus TaxID=2598579 RepID=UPI00143D0FFB|nr:hypothetical protein [Limnoglobus roseus]